MEIELQPAGVLRQNSDTSLIAPFAIFNYGFAKNWDRPRPRAVSADEPGRQREVNGVGAFLKHVEEEPPGRQWAERRDERAAVAGRQCRQRLECFGNNRPNAGIKRHANVVAELTRDHRADYFVSIIEGPSKWNVRPVAEFFYEEEIGQSRTLSAWSVRSGK